MEFLQTQFGTDNKVAESEMAMTNIDVSQFSTLTKEEICDFSSLIEWYAGLAFEKQFLLWDEVGEESWNIDIDRNIISFTEKTFAIQLIGTFSYVSSSWMWAWANESLDIPENLLVHANQLKALGEQKGISQLTDAKFDIDEGFEHQIGIIASGLCDAKSYYCADFGDGALVVTITDKAFPTINQEDVITVPSTFAQLVSGIEVNHKRAFKNYLIDRQFKIYQSGNKIQGLKGKHVLTGEFDDADRLTDMDLAINGAS